jgi:hypothetical protein
MTMGEVKVPIVDEACAVLEGRVVDQLWAKGSPIPAWAWLNALAHRPAGEIGDLVGVACDQPGDRWADAVVDIALDLSQVAATEAAKLQSQLFAPVELEALAGRSVPDSPSQLVRALRRRLISDAHRRTLNLRDHPDQGPT